MPQPRMFPTFPLLMAVSALPVITFVATYVISLTVKHNDEHLMEYPYFFLSSSIQVRSFGSTPMFSFNNNNNSSLPHRCSHSTTTTTLPFHTDVLIQQQQNKPASCVGTFGLSLTCFALPILAVIRHEHVKKCSVRTFSNSSNNGTCTSTPRSGVSAIGPPLRRYIMTPTPPVPGPTPNTVPSHVKLLNTRAFNCSVVTALGGLGVCSFQSGRSDCEGWEITKITQGFHMVFASIFFLGGMTYAFLMWRIDTHIPTLGSSLERKSRAFFAILSIFQLLVLVLVLPALIYFNGLPDSPGIEIMSFFEISLLITFMSTFITFIPDFRRSHFSLLVWHDDRRYSITERFEGLLQESGGGGADGEDITSYRSLNDGDSKVVVP